MVSLSIKSWVFGVVVGYLGYGLLCGEFVNNLFTLILVAAVVAGNMFVLVVGTAYVTEITLGARQGWSSLSPSRS